VGQGFNGGLSALLAHFGGEEVKQAPPEPPKISRTGAISLSKGQTISLAKEQGLDEVIMGLGWDVKKHGGFFGGLLGIDLDASCLLFDNKGGLMEAVYFGHLRSKDGSVRHTGDNLTGAGEGDDEQIIVRLSQLPSSVQTLVFVVNSFLGQSFSQIENAFCRLVNRKNNEEIARYNLSAQGSHTAMLMTKIYKDPSGWQLQALGIPASGRTFRALVPIIKSSVL
jgi:tellurium resistance protein TerZ